MLAAQLRHLLTTVAEEAARSSGCVQRVRKLTGASLVQTLVLGWLANPQASRAELTRLAALRGVQLSAQALDQRLTPALQACLAQVLAAVVQTLVVHEAVRLPLLQRFAGIYLLDTTSLTLPDALATDWPGCGGQAGQGQAAIKLGVQLEVCHGTLHGPELVAGRTNDRRLAVAHQPLPPGSLRIADLGFFSVADLAALQAQGSTFLTRWQANTAVADPDGTRWVAVADRLAQLAAAQDGRLGEGPVLLGAQLQVPVRLIALRVPPEVAASRRRAKRRRAQRNGYTARQASLAVCDWTVLVTNVPVEQLSAEEAVVLLRLRWQIELLFRRWKSQAGLANWRSTKPVHLMCELYAKLLGCVVSHWLLVLGCWHIPDRSLAQADQVVRQHTRLLALTFDDAERLIGALQQVTALLTVNCRLPKRRARPNAVQLLLDPHLAV
jgi:hypothetical protein